MLYLWLKALHVAAVLTWVGGVLAAAVVLAALASDPAAGAGRRDGTGLIQAVRRWDHGVTTPAMLLVWGLGLALALHGGWFTRGGTPSGWLAAKLVLVLALSGLHGVQSGTLRRLAGGETQSAGRSARVAPRLILALLAGVVCFVVLKPF